MLLSTFGRRLSGRSGIRAIMDDIADVAADPSATGRWVNLSPGNPSAIPDAVEAWQRLTADAVSADFTATSCCYGPSRGYGPLVDAIVEYFNDRYDWGITAENVVVGPGSQLLCFAAACLFTGPGPTGFRRLVLPAQPDYAGYQGLTLDADGLTGIPARIVRTGEHLFRYAVDLDAVRRTPDIGMLLVSSPGNPTGRALERDELDGLVAIAADRDIPLLVDNAYGQPFPLVVETPVAPVRHPSVLNSFTFSKAGLPGDRLGFLIGEPELIFPIVSYLANTALHAPQLVQSVTARALRSREIDTLVEKTISPYYRAKRQFAERALSDALPSDMSWRLHESSGGMFCWLWMDHDWFDDHEAYEALKRLRVFVVPGHHFFVAPRGGFPAGDHGTRCLRLSLSPDEDTIAEGIARLAEVLREQRANGDRS
ncbi:aminotransferase class I/II-fold pyridoxal phosphate-dependent enzyme [Actinoplanes sp. TBRC 11911]|uniref:aminotransferase class I/II-fold pyridoxal phosphate-dependent enzyme n=1 Tax=Actinoplanes sp. TBRC 11911 TaxID=2729386 RepID=UPI00145C8013|nr:aminotransferase class I/II-fold pyridoxal phosphate-dependent enzyme [Actinoplanes sp. TBRC 11911]NMO50553.1 aminotransferase class I/II-fold pyridoxal phosphate-dependent enzyme [Actinoplanes sp. TBRC 11911]